MDTNRITVAYGDGIGPEIMKATLEILDAAGANLTYDVIEIGEKVYLAGNTSGISDENWHTLEKNKIFLKAPITTPQGGGYQSLNVAIRKTLGLFSNVRPCVSYAPFVATNFPKMDLVIIRENEEDLYAGIEHQQTEDVIQCLKLVSVQGTEKIIRYAFEYAVAHNRKHVTCMSKDNIMKMTDGMFHRTFDRIAKEYPNISSDHYIIDIGAAKLASDPERFDVIVTLNLYGDIISDIAADVAGSVGLGGSSNVGENFAMFEAIHGSAPDIAGLDIANPSGLINGACMMLVQIGKAEIAESIQNALLKTIEDGIHTGDIYKEGKSKQKVGTKEFTQAIINRLGQEPVQFIPVQLNHNAKPIVIKLTDKEPIDKQLCGVDVFLRWEDSDKNPKVLGDLVNQVSTESLKLDMISNRGVVVYPNGHPSTFCTSHWRCRFKAIEARNITYSDILSLLNKLNSQDLTIIKTENLYLFDGKPVYSIGQGEK
ncbi:MAG: NADP-dependent isocitrate dehydrogenase [Bacteroidia bacterium]